MLSKCNHPSSSICGAEKFPTEFVYDPSGWSFIVALGHTDDRRIHCIDTRQKKDFAEQQSDFIYDVELHQKIHGMILRNPMGQEAPRDLFSCVQFPTLSKKICLAINFCCSDSPGGSLPRRCSRANFVVTSCVGQGLGMSRTYAGYGHWMSCTSDTMIQIFVQTRLCQC